MIQIDEERLGKMADELDAILHITKLALPPKMHIEALTGKIREVRDELATMVCTATGDNPWADNPLEG